jgi:hypothetical protein
MLKAGDAREVVRPADQDPPTPASAQILAYLM